MILRLVREPSVHGATLGCLFVNGHFACFTLEDQLRDGEKIAGTTAIPAGRYRLMLSKSARFQRVLPLLLNVPNFDGIRIHAGNTIADTEGCILVGKDRLQGRLLQSRIALEALLAQLQSATGDIWITVENPPAQAAAA